jgi:hypothetical protein
MLGLQLKIVKPPRVVGYVKALSTPIFLMAFCLLLFVAEDRSIHSKH